MASDSSDDFDYQKMLREWRESGRPGPFNPFEIAVTKIAARDGRYDVGAYLFLKDALDFTLKRAADSNHGQQRHVSGGEVCLGFRDLALEQFGSMADTTMTEWRLQRTSDIGAMVYLLIDAQILGKVDSDLPEHFDDVYDFKDAFGPGSAK